MNQDRYSSAARLWVKSMLRSRGMTMKQLVERYNEKFPDDQTSQQNLSNKLNRGTIRYSEIMQIAEVLWYKPTFIPLNEAATLSAGIPLDPQPDIEDLPDSSSLSSHEASARSIFPNIPGAWDYSLSGLDTTVEISDRTDINTDQINAIRHSLLYLQKFLLRLSSTVDTMQSHMKQNTASSQTAVQTSGADESPSTDAPEAPYDPDNSD